MLLSIVPQINATHCADYPAGACPPDMASNIETLNSLLPSQVVAPPWAAAGRRVTVHAAMSTLKPNGKKGAITLTGFASRSAGMRKWPGRGRRPPWQLQVAIKHTVAVAEAALASPLGGDCTTCVLRSFEANALAHNFALHVKSAALPLC